MSAEGAGCVISEEHKPLTSKDVVEVGSMRVSGTSQESSDGIHPDVWLAGDPASTKRCP